MPRRETKEQQMARFGINPKPVVSEESDTRVKKGGVLVPKGRPEFGTAQGSTVNRTVARV